MLIPPVVSMILMRSAPKKVGFYYSISASERELTEEDILKGMMTLEPVANPNRRVGYSGLAFTLLSYAISGFSGGKSYNKLLDELLVSPFKLGNTGAMPGNTSRAVVPNIGSWWGRDVGEETP